MEEVRAKIFNYVRANGPVLPVEIAKSIGSDILFAGAVLAEMVASKKVMISTAKIGGSPVYYTPEQKGKLDMLVPKLGEKPQKAAVMLREKKVLFDDDCEPWLRVALREIKDFAVPLKIKLDGKESIVWKWYMLETKDVEPIIRKAVGLDKPKEESKEVVKPIDNKEEVKPVEENREAVKEREEVKEPVADQGSFYENVIDYLQKKGLRVIKEDTIRKKKEFDFIVEHRSEFGELRYFVKAKDKKKINNSDLDLALHKAKNKNVLFFSKGELTKKADEYIEKDLKGSIVFNSI